jgi:large subunit ribosomal protein L24
MKKNKFYIKKGDIVQIIAGDNKGFIGKVGSIFPKKSILFVEGINPRKKCIKKSKEAEAKEIQLEIPIHISNVLLWDKESALASKIGYAIIKNKKCRYFKKSNYLVDITEFDYNDKDFDFNWEDFDYYDEDLGNLDYDWEDLDNILSSHNSKVIENTVDSQDSKVVKKTLSSYKFIDLDDIPLFNNFKNLNNMPPVNDIENLNDIQKIDKK